jgi:hypothetical protein
MCNAFVYSASCRSRLLTILGGNPYPLLPLLLNETWKALICYLRLNHSLGRGEGQTCENDRRTKTDQSCQSSFKSVHAQLTAEAGNCSCRHLPFLQLLGSVKLASTSARERPGFRRI